MSKKTRCICSYVSALIFLALIGGCVSTGVTYFPKSLETTPVADIVKVVCPDTERIVEIDEKKVSSAPVMYVLPGNHTYTFRIKYRSKTYCNGPSYGLEAKRDFVIENGEVSSVIFMDGNYSMDVSAKKGQTVTFTVKPEPDCKSKVYDYFKATVTP